MDECPRALEGPPVGPPSVIPKFDFDGLCEALNVNARAESSAAVNLDDLAGGHAAI